MQVGLHNSWLRGFESSPFVFSFFVYAELFFFLLPHPLLHSRANVPAKSYQKLTVNLSLSPFLPCPSTCNYTLNIITNIQTTVLVAEVVKHLCPRLVEMHNYQPANSVKQKLANWHTLQHKVLRKLDLTVPENVLQGVVSMKPGVVSSCWIMFFWGNSLSSTVRTVLY